MVKKTPVNPDSLGASAGAFSRAVRVGNLLYISGTTAVSHLSGNYFERAIEPTMEAQARQTFKNIEKVLTAVGGTMENVVKIAVVIKNARDFKEMDAVRGEVFSKNPPASYTICADLVRDDVLIEVQADAVLDD